MFIIIIINLNIVLISFQPIYVASLCAELRDPHKPNISRHLAGILLKNALVAKDDARQLALNQRWNSLMPEVC